MGDLVETLSSIARDHQNALATLAGFVENVRHFIVTQADRSGREIEQPRSFLRPPITLMSTDAQMEEVLAAEKREVEEMRRRFESIRSLTRGYEELLYRMAFIYRVALCEAFIPDVLLAVILTQKSILKSGKSLTFQEIIDHVEKGTLIEVMARKVITPLSYNSIDKQMEWIKEKLGIDLIAGLKDVVELIEIGARRNLFAHANGVVNRIYLELVPSSSHIVGDQLEVSYDYWYRANILLRDICLSLLQSVTNKFSPGQTLPPYFDFG
jgi:hypothetical protein